MRPENWFSTWSRRLVFKNARRWINIVPEKWRLYNPEGFLVCNLIHGEACFCLGCSIAKKTLGIKILITTAHEQTIEKKTDLLWVWQFVRKLRKQWRIGACRKCDQIWNVYKEASAIARVFEVSEIISADSENMTNVSVVSELVIPVFLNHGCLKLKISALRQGEWALNQWCLALIA